MFLLVIILMLRLKNKQGVKKYYKHLLLNILKPRGNPEIFVDRNEDVILIPYLYDLEMEQFNTKAIFEIQKLFNKQQ